MHIHTRARLMRRFLLLIYTHSHATHPTHDQHTLTQESLTLTLTLTLFDLIELISEVASGEPFALLTHTSNTQHKYLTHSRMSRIIRQTHTHTLTLTHTCFSSPPADGERA